MSVFYNTNNYAYHVSAVACLVHIILYYYRCVHCLILYLKPSYYIIAAGPSKFRHISSFDTDIPGMSCPSPLQLRAIGSNRLCEKKTGNSCASVTISAGGQSYTKVRGKVTAYAYRSLDAFRRLHGAGSGIDDPYVDGISITYGSPRKHVWTYAGGSTNLDFSCPDIANNHDIAKQPAFVGKNYLCVVAGYLVQQDSDRFFNAPLFTTLGDCVGDCPDDLAFCVTLDEPTSDDLELRLCTDQSKTDEDIFLKSYDFYIQ